ncbi:MAG: hypothetical protein KAT28_02375 [Candidatus Aenigmarchaeota archaeon]|nr:hypothetical protein [Candidatus Aenigmarchaeota archaeon]
MEDKIKELITARLRRMPLNYKFAIRGKYLNRDELISCVDEGNELGERIIKMHLNYLRSFKKNVE